MMKWAGVFVNYKQKVLYNLAGKGFQRIVSFNLPLHRVSENFLVNDFKAKNQKDIVENIYLHNVLRWLTIKKIFHLIVLNGMRWNKRRRYDNMAENRIIASFLY